MGAARPHLGHQRRDHKPRGRHLGFYFRLLPDDVNVHGEDIVAFLCQSRYHISEPMDILWDGAQIHDRSKAVRAYLAEHPEIVTERLPGYAPETNPDENVWQDTKYSRLANFAPEDTRELRKAMIEELAGLIVTPASWRLSSAMPEIPVRLQGLAC